MGLHTIANRYARALADITIERDESRRVLSELESLQKTLSENQDLVDFIESPVVTIDRKREVVQQLLREKDLSGTTTNFLNLLLENYRLHRLELMLKSFERELDHRAGIVSAEVTTARPISEAEQNGLRERLRTAPGQEVRLRFATDPDVIGGVVTRIGSTVYDGSIRTQLAQIKEQLARAK